MIDKAGKSSANQNGGQTSVRYLELETEHPPMAPTQLSKCLILKRRPQLLRAGRRRDKNLILICHLSLEER